MEPIAAVGVVSKLISFALKGVSAVRSGQLGKEDVEALQSAIDLGAAIAGARSAVTPELAAEHLALIARCFGQAVVRYQDKLGMRSLHAGLRRWLDRNERELNHEIETRVRFAFRAPVRFGDSPRGDVDAVPSLTGSPLATPYYRRLWEAFSAPELTEPGQTPPFELTQTARREFERYFLLAYLPALESPVGKAVATYLERLEDYRASRVQELLLQDLATWGGRHVFGNLPRERWPEEEPVPFLTLEDMFVECDAAVEDAHGKLGEPQPIIGLLERLVAADNPRRVVVVIAHFGSGKSIAARTLARRWAEHALTSTAVGPDNPIPIYMKCSEDFSSDSVDLATTARRAWRRQADVFGLSIPEDDAALRWPGNDQRTVCLLDGLDEVVLGDQQQKALFQRLRDKTNENHRFIVFSRPSAVLARADLGEHVVAVRVQPFSDPQIAAWILAWNRARPGAEPLTLQMIEARRLAEIVKTPILLFMVAFTAERYAGRSDPASLAWIYEDFFVQIAAGKANVDRERHGPISKASDELLTALIAVGILGTGAQPVDAMLWLMGRVAWEAQKLEQRDPPETLRRRHIETILAEHKLGLGADVSHAIEIGLVLALQSDLRAANHPILFGHQSFREFLVGRHWALHLSRVIEERPGRARDALARELYGGRLLGDENKSWQFLLEIVNSVIDTERATSPFRWTGSRRARLVDWAQETFEDESQEFASTARMSIGDDQRAALREAALTIGSRTNGSKGLRGKTPRTLRSLLTWFSYVGQLPQLMANHADFQNAFLEGCFIVEAELARGQLDGVNLGQAKITSSIFTHSSLRKANLSQTILVAMHFNHAVLQGASFLDAIIRHSWFACANLQEVDFRNVNIRFSDFTEARMHAADLRGASLIACDLTRAQLVGAKLAEADLLESDLRGADLRGADLFHVKLKGVKYNHETMWPDGFSLASYGLVFES